MIGRWAQRFAVAIERPLVGYLMALGAVAAAVVVRVLAGLLMASPPNFMAFFPAVLFATLVAGLRGRGLDVPVMHPASLLAQALADQDAGGVGTT